MRMWLGPEPASVRLDEVDISAIRVDSISAFSASISPFRVSHNHCQVALKAEIKMAQFCGFRAGPFTKPDSDGHRETDPIAKIRRVIGLNCTIIDPAFSS